jgi:Aflatoxin regulatory protein/Fungal Zn(2)-Cys(6) binuclear cluster domain
MPDVNRSSGPTSSRLRDSCHNCALSKVKCPREKPSCSRCKTRGITCQYFVVKRPGRRRMSTSPNSPNKSNNNNNDNDNDDSHDDGVPATGTDDTMHFITPPPSLSWTSMQPENALVADFSDALSAVGDVGISPGLPDFGSELPSMDFFTTSFGLPVLDDMAALMPAESVPSTRQTSMPCSDACSGGCLTQALDLLKSISVDVSGPGSASTSWPQALLVENKLSTDAVHRMLACSCTEDGFLLTVLSMIMLKVLGRYSAAAGRDTARQPGCGYGTPPADGDEQQRIAARMVLSELHRVQRLVNQLSPRLKRRRDTGRPPGSLQGWGADRDIWGCLTGILGDRDDPPVTLFSASTMDQMESDLRKSLSTLSLGIIHNLRQS